MVRLAHLLTSDRGLAEDIAQEAFVRTWRAWNRIRQGGLGPRVPAVDGLNLARSSLRRRLVERRHDTAAPEGWDDLDAAGRMAVLEALRRLPRAVVVLRYHLDLSEQQTAEALRIARGTVKSQTHRALARLGELLSDE
jgi:DNA-directed RNA polymerase specialized sigma24 family protein